MTLSDDAIEALGDRLYAAYRDARPATPPSETHDLTVEDAYRVQRAAVECRGEPLAGYKIGFTNERVQSQIGVEEPAYGRITDDTVSDRASVNVDAFVSPRVEPELAFVLDSIEPPVHAHGVLASTRAIVPVIEIVDSRTGDWSPTPVDAVADNALAAAVRVGDRSGGIEGMDLSMEAVQVRRNGELVETGVGANVLEHPVRAVRWLANRRTLPAGTVVLTGSLTPTVELADGDVVEVRFSTLGSVSIRAA